MSNKDSMGGFGQLYAEEAPPFPPLDMAYLAAYLRKDGHAVVVHDCAALGWSLDDLAKTCGNDREFHAALVLVRTSLPTIDVDLQTCARLAGMQDAGRVALFGPVIPSLLKRIEQDQTLSFVFLTEPDRPAAALMRGESVGQIPGIGYREGAAWTHTADLPFEKNLDALPFPAWDLLPYKEYVIPKSSTSGSARFLPMLSSRGCPFGCSYCPYPVGQGLKWRYRSASNVVDEMQFLVEKFGVEYILFRDPMFSAQQKRVMAICREIIARGIKVYWKCETRMDCLDDETIELMARAGCVGINFGVESTDPEIQKGVHRTPILPEEFVAKVASCREHGVATFAFFVIGLPGDTLRTILDSIEFAIRIRANWTQFTMATPFIGTPMYKWALNERLIEADFYKIVSAHERSVGNENLTGADIKRLHRFARFLQDHILNRHGILKNDRRKGLAYRSLKAIADFASRSAALTLFHAARWHFTRSVSHKPRAGRSALPRSEPIRVAK